VISGDDGITLALLALGGDGVISVAANQVPAMLSEMVRTAFAGDWQMARQIHYKLLPLMEINFIETNPIPVKTAMAMMGLLDENFRLPLVKMANENKEKLRAVLEELDLV